MAQFHTSRESLFAGERADAWVGLNRSTAYDKSMLFLAALIDKVRCLKLRVPTSASMIEARPATFSRTNSLS
jgi:hypothetical protein